MPSSIRILTPLHSFEPGGVERVALRLNAEWQANGVETAVIMGRDAGAMRTGVPLPRYTAFGQPGFTTAWFETLWMIIRLPQAIRTFQPDVLFCAGNTYAVVMLAMRLLLGPHCPVIVIKVSNDLRRRDMNVVGRWFYRRWLRLQGRFIHAFVGMAEPMRAEIAEAVGIEPAMVLIVEDAALSAGEFLALGQPHIKPMLGKHFLAAGRLAPQKNFPMMLRAFARAAGADDHLTIIGEGPERAGLERLVHTLGLTGRVSLPGHQTAATDHFLRADCFLLSSDYEGVPAVVIEALAAGLPIIATACSVSMDYLLQSGRLGILIPVGDECQLTEAIKLRGSNPGSAVAAREHAARFTVEKAAQAYLGVFARTVASQSKFLEANTMTAAAFPIQ